MFFSIIASRTATRFPDSSLEQAAQQLASLFLRWSKPHSNSLPCFFAEASRTATRFPFSSLERAAQQLASLILRWSKPHSNSLP